MTKVLSQTGLTELIQLSKNEFLPKSGAVEATTVTLATVATSGSYNDLSNKPTIPTTTSSVTSGSTAALTSGGAYTALSEKINTSAIQSSVSSSSTNSQVVGAKLFYDTCGDIENLINAL